jgi:hypothetical protein
MRGRGGDGDGGCGDGVGMGTAAAGTDGDGDESQPLCRSLVYDDGDYHKETVESEFFLLASGGRVGIRC